MLVNFYFILNSLILCYRTTVYSVWNIIYFKFIWHNFSVEFWDSSMDQGIYVFINIMEAYVV